MEIKLPAPDRQCRDDEAKSLRDVWSYSPDLVRQIIEADRAQRGEPVAWGLPRDDGIVIDVVSPEAHDSFAGEYVIPLYTAPQPAHTEAEVQALLDAGQKLATMRYDDAEFEKYVRRILGVPKP